MQMGVEVAAVLESGDAGAAGGLAADRRGHASGGRGAGDGRELRDQPQYQRELQGAQRCAGGGRAGGLRQGRDRALRALPPAARRNWRGSIRFRYRRWRRNRRTRSRSRSRDWDCTVRGSRRSMRGGRAGSSSSTASLRSRCATATYRRATCATASTRSCWPIPRPRSIMDGYRARHHSRRVCRRHRRARRRSAARFRALRRHPDHVQQRLPVRHRTFSSAGGERARESDSRPVLLFGLAAATWKCATWRIRWQRECRANPIVMFERGPAFDTRPGFRGNVLASYPRDEIRWPAATCCIPERIQGKAAALEVFYGEGAST